MPTYLFRCQKCQRDFEADCTLAEKERGCKPCPHCQATDTKARFSVGHFLKNIFAAKEKSCCSGGTCYPPKHNKN